MPERPFLTCQWRDLALLSYTVPAEVLAPFLTPGLELDTFEGSPVVSLVGFNFLDTRVGGVPWPGYRDFAELNLRFYVRQGDRRGVVFVREIVPLRLVTWMARGLYREPYICAPLTHTVRGGEVETRLRWGGREHTLRVCGAAAYRPGPDTPEQWFKEHRWGFGRSASGSTLMYRVLHPTWDVRKVESFELDLDWGSVYGRRWAFLQDQSPCSVVLAVGSKVAVFGAREI